MSTSFKQIEILLANLPYAAEAYDHTGKLVAVNTAWRNMWNWKGKNLPESIIFNNRLVNKTGTLSIIRKIFKEGGSVRTPPVICETGDLEFTKTGIDSVFRFYIYSLKNDDLEGTFVINLTEDVNTEIRKSEEKKNEEKKKLELRKRNS